MASRDALTETREEPGWKTGAALRVRRAHYLILGGAVLVLAGWLLAIRVLVPAILQSGVVETLGEVAALQRRLIESGNVEKADVQIGQTTSTKGAERHLKVNAVWRGEPDSAESAATRLADVVLQTYAGIDNIDKLYITIGKALGAGPVTFRQGTSYAHSPSEWKVLVERSRQSSS